MTARVDHATEARDWLRVASSTSSFGDGTNPAAALALQEAQVHATLALAEQQRAATIVAIWSMETGPKIAFLRDAGLTAESGFEAAREAAKILGLS